MTDAENHDFDAELRGLEVAPPTPASVQPTQAGIDLMRENEAFNSAAEKRREDLKQRHIARDANFEGTPPDEVWGSAAVETCETFIDFADRHSFAGSTILKNGIFHNSVVDPSSRIRIIRNALSRTKDMYGKGGPLHDQQKDFMRRTVKSVGDVAAEGGENGSKGRIGRPVSYRGSYIHNPKAVYLSDQIRELKGEPQYSSVDFEIRGYPVAVFNDFINGIHNDYLERNVYLCEDGTLRHIVTDFRDSPLRRKPQAIGTTLASIPPSELYGREWIPKLCTVEHFAGEVEKDISYNSGAKHYSRTTQFIAADIRTVLKQTAEEILEAEKAI